MLGSHKALDLNCLDPCLDPNPVCHVTDQYGVVSLWPLALAMVEGAETFFYIYEVDLLWVWTGWGASIIRTTTPAHSPTASVLPPSADIRLGCGRILMTCSHGWWWSNTLYIYKEDLLWVWTGWGVSIISTNRGSKCESMHNITFRPLRAYIRVELHRYDP